MFQIYWIVYIAILFTYRFLYVYSVASLIFLISESRYNLWYLNCTIKNVLQGAVSGTSHVKIYALSSIGMYKYFILKQSLPHGCRTGLFSVR